MDNSKEISFETKKEKPSKETESLLKAAQNNVMRTNYVKVKIDNTQQGLVSLF